MVKAFVDLAAADQEKELLHADWLALLLDREVSWRKGKRRMARLRAARLRHQASLEVRKAKAPAEAGTPGPSLTGDEVAREPGTPRHLLALLRLRFLSMK
jgi:hypothetical protein